MAFIYASEDDATMRQAGTYFELPGRGHVVAENDERLRHIDDYRHDAAAIYAQMPAGYMTRSCAAEGAYARVRHLFFDIAIFARENSFKNIGQAVITRAPHTCTGAHADIYAT